MCVLGLTLASSGNWLETGFAKAKHSLRNDRERVSICKRKECAVCFEMKEWHLMGGGYLQCIYTLLFLPLS